MTKLFVSVLLVVTTLKIGSAFAGGGGGGYHEVKKFARCDVLNTANSITVLLAVNHSYNEIGGRSSGTNPVIQFLTGEGKELTIAGTDGAYSPEMQNKPTHWKIVSWKSPLVLPSDDTVQVILNIDVKSGGTIKAITNENGTVIVNAKVKCRPILN